MRLYTNIFTICVINLLRKDKHSGDEISNFQPLTVLDTELMILAKI